MTRQTLASRIAKAEGLKSQVSIGNIREILKVIARIELDSTDWSYISGTGDVSGWLEDEKVKYSQKRKGKK